MWLKQSTASQEISLGQFLDSTDGNTEEDGLTIANTDIKLRKGGTTTLASKNSGGATSISNGVYHATLDATDTNTLGLLEVYVHVAGALATKSTYMILPATTYDAMITNGLNDLSAAQVNTECDTALTDYDGPTNAEMVARTRLDADYFSWATDAVANVTLVATTTTNTDMVGTNNALLASGYTAPDNTSISSILVDTNDLQANQGNWLTATGFATTAEIADVPTVSEFNARTIPSADYFDPATDAVANVTLVATTTTNTDMVSAAPTVTQILTTQMTESYSADGVAPTLAQSLFLTMQNLQDFSFAGTTQTVKKIDGSTTAATYTLDSATDPITSKTRAT